MSTQLVGHTLHTFHSSQYHPHAAFDCRSIILPDGQCVPPIVAGMAKVSHHKLSAPMLNAVAPTLNAAPTAATPSPELIVGVADLGATTPRMGRCVSAADTDPATTAGKSVPAPARWQAADAAQDGPLARASGASPAIEERRSRRPRARTGGLHHGGSQH